MSRLVYKWLPIIFGCHQRPERSFYYKGERFPICARCTGELVGMLIGIVGIYWFIEAPVWLWIALMCPLILDGVIQLITKYESTNARRFVSGVLFGISIIVLFSQSTVWAFEYGKNLGKNL